MRSPQKCLQKSVKKIVFFLNWQILENKTKAKQKNPQTGFLGIATYNTCAKFQGKILNPTLVGAPGSLRFLNKRHWFFAKNKSLSKITYQYFSVQNQYNQTITKFVLKRNFQDI